MKNQYKAAAYAGFSDVEAQRIGDYLDKVRGNLTPHRIVDEARPKDSPLHKHFEWDDTEAAEAYRREQAGFLVRKIHLVITETDEMPADSKGGIRAFHSVDKMNGNKHSPRYVHIKKVKKNPDMMTQVVANAYRELRAYQEKYRQYKALETIIAGPVELAIVSLSVIQEEIAA